MGVGARRGRNGPRFDSRGPSARRCRRRGGGRRPREWEGAGSSGRASSAPPSSVGPQPGPSGPAVVGEPWACASSGCGLGGGWGWGRCAVGVGWGVEGRSPRAAHRRSGRGAGFARGGAAGAVARDAAPAGFGG